MVAKSVEDADWQAGGKLPGLYVGFMAGTRAEPRET
jgi:hypothetical protein